LSANGSGPPIPRFVMASAGWRFFRIEGRPADHFPAVAPWSATNRFRQPADLGRTGSSRLKAVVTIAPGDVRGSGLSVLVTALFLFDL
jgi:hypothetical protein